MVDDWGLGVVVFEKAQSSCGKYVADGGGDVGCGGGGGHWWPAVVSSGGQRWPAGREIPQEGPSESRASSRTRVTRRARAGQYARLWWESQGSGENRRGVLDAGRVR